MILKALKFAAISLAIYLVVALGLVASQSPGEVKSDAQSLDFDNILSKGAADDPVPGIAETTEIVQMGSPVDQSAVFSVKLFRGPDAAQKPILLMAHGSGWHGGQFDPLARALADLAEVRVVTLRGHGATLERRGDVDYIGQFEDDLAYVLANAGRREVIALGHSSGGGLVVRMAGGAHGGLIDRAILLAPFLQYDAPMTRPNSGGWARPLTRRIIGLSMLNMLGIHALDHLTVIRFAMPRAVLAGPQGHMATTAYSGRLNQSCAPRRDWRADVAKLPEFLLIAGAQDEAFDAALYAPAMTPANPNGRYEIVPGVGHLGIVDAPQTLALIRDFLR